MLKLRLLSFSIFCTQQSLCLLHFIQDLLQLLHLLLVLRVGQGRHLAAEEGQAAHQQYGDNSHGYDIEAWGWQEGVLTSSQRAGGLNIVEDSYIAYIGQIWKSQDSKGEIQNVKFAPKINVKVITFSRTLVPKYNIFPH